MAGSPGSSEWVALTDKLAVQETSFSVIPVPIIWWKVFYGNFCLILPKMSASGVWDVQPVRSRTLW